MEVKVKFFAVCKDYFESEQVFSASDVNELKSILIKEQPSFYTILENCKFIVGKDVMSDDYMFNENDLVLILPPSSGG